MPAVPGQQPPARTASCRGLARQPRRGGPASALAHAGFGCHGQRADEAAPVAYVCHCTPSGAGDRQPGDECGRLMFQCSRQPSLKGHATAGPERCHRSPMDCRAQCRPSDANGGDPPPRRLGHDLRSVIRPDVVRDAAEDELIRQEIDDARRLGRTSPPMSRPGPGTCKVRRSRMPHPTPPRTPPRDLPGTIGKPPPRRPRLYRHPRRDHRVDLTVALTGWIAPSPGEPRGGSGRRWRERGLV